MFENLKNIFRKNKKNEPAKSNSKDAAKERLHLVLMQDRANVSVDFLDLMRKEIIEVIKKYIDIDEKSMDVRLTAETKEDGTQGAPALYANIPIVNIKDETRKLSKVNSSEKVETAQVEEESIEQIHIEEMVKEVMAEAEKQDANLDEKIEEDTENDENKSESVETESTETESEEENEDKENNSKSENINESEVENKTENIDNNEENSNDDIEKKKHKKDKKIIKEEKKNEE